MRLPKNRRTIIHDGRGRTRRSGAGRAGTASRRPFSPCASVARLTPSRRVALREIVAARSRRSRVALLQLILLCCNPSLSSAAAAGGSDHPQTNETHDQPQLSLAAECDAQATRTLRGRHVSFEFDSSTIRNSSRGLLDALVDLAAECRGLDVVVTGHTDASGDARYNLLLSKRRAEAVRDYLIARGISAIRIVAVGVGASQPLASEDKRAGRARNRRIEFGFVAPGDRRYRGSGRPSMPASSTSNTSVDPGGMTAPAPRSP